MPEKDIACLLIDTSGGVLADAIANPKRTRLELQASRKRFVRLILNLAGWKRLAAKSGEGFLSHFKNLLCFVCHRLLWWELADFEWLCISPQWAEYKKNVIIDVVYFAMLYSFFYVQKKTKIQRTIFFHSEIFNSWFNIPVTFDEIITEIIIKNIRSIKRWVFNSIH